MRTSDSLGIYWSFVDGDSGELYQDEVAGLILFGFWKAAYSPEVMEKAAFLNNIWKGFADIKLREWEGDALSNLSVEIKINSWPIEKVWKKYIEASLRWFVDNGALISWCGGELSSPSLSVFHPESGAGSVYAAYCESIGFACGSELNSEYHDLDAVALEKFAGAVKASGVVVF